MTDFNNKYDTKRFFYDYVAVILVYRNTIDLKECINSIYKKISSVKIIVVNAFYDKESEKQINEIAKELSCDFIGIENKGYSYGNNRGIEFALEHYNFKYIIISNPDIVVERFIECNKQDCDIIAPQIITANGKKQNPMIIKESKLAEYLIYSGLKKNSRLFFLMGILLNKLQRIFLFLKKEDSIFAAHGSFVIMKKKVVDMIKPLYDENLFLFAEEGVLAYRCREKGLKTVYDSNIVIHHKEDGCMRLADFSVNNELKKANIYFYEKYVLNSKGICN